MSVSAIVRCEGTRPNMPCRGNLPITLPPGMFNTHTAELTAVTRMGWRFVTIEGRPRLLCASGGHLEEE